MWIKEGKKQVVRFKTADFVWPLVSRHQPYVTETKLWEKAVEGNENTPKLWLPVTFKFLLFATNFIMLFFFLVWFTFFLVYEITENCEV